MKRAAAIGVSLTALCLTACQPAQDGSAAFDARVKAYLMTHPDVLRAAIQSMQAKEDAEAEAAANTHVKTVLPALRAALERDPRDFVANPGGKVTVTEFYDYRCPHCINIAPQVVTLIRAHPDVRFVFKEMPIFGSVSDHAARAALAAKTQGKDYVGLYEALMSTQPLTDQEIDRLAAAKGVDVAAMNAPAAVARDQVHLHDTTELAGKLSIDGTPGFIVGDSVIRGEDYDGLTAAIAKAEKTA